MSEFKNRIVGYGKEPVDQILFNPQNWRIHPKAQQDALTGVLEEIGWVQNVVINKTTGHLVDGHLRVQLADRAEEKTVPVTYVELSESEEMTVLATIDPIAAMAATDKEKLDELIEMIGKDPLPLMQPIIQEEILRPSFKKHHILLSFPIEKIVDVSSIISELIKNDWIEIEQSTN